VIRSLAQAVLAQAILAFARHRQTRAFLHAPAGVAEAAAVKYRSAGGTGKAA